MKSYTIIIILSHCFFTFSCVNLNNFQIKIYLETSEGNNLVYTIKEKDILCIDWKHQSFLLYPKIANELNKIPTIGGGKHVFRFFWKGDELYNVRFWSQYSSFSFDFKSPYIQFNDSKGNGVTRNNWLIINPYNPSSNYSNNRQESLADYEKMFNYNIYEYFYNKGLLNAVNWECIKKPQSHITNKPDYDFWINKKRAGY